LSAYGCVDRDYAGVVVGRVLIEALMWTVPIEVVLVLPQHRKSVLFIVDEHSVGALGPDTSHEPFRKTRSPKVSVAES
jgi:hypothetical protein